MISPTSRVVRRLAHVGAAFAGWLLLILGGVLARAQRLVGVEAVPRGLTDRERERLGTVFRRSVALDRIRIVQGRAGLFGVNERPFTLGRTIYLKDVDLSTRFDVLVHECVHVWQYEHLGAGYAARALAAQVRHGWRSRGAYDWEAEVARGRHRWLDLNLEAQASFIQAMWRQGDGTLFEDGATSSLVVEGRSYDDLAIDALRTLRP